MRISNGYVARKMGNLPVSTLAAVVGIRENVHTVVAAYVRFCRWACASATDAH
jgi:hypothetical protein